MQNTGISFGIPLPGGTVLIGLAAAIMLYWAIRERSLGLMLIVVGGTLNLSERLIFGYVTDYWKIPYLPLYNNINDWIIFVGLAIFLWQKLRKSK